MVFIIHRSYFLLNIIWNTSPRVIVGLAIRRRRERTGARQLCYSGFPWLSTPLDLRATYTVGHKKEPTYFCLQLSKNQQILMRFSLLDLQMNDRRESINFTHLT